MQKNNGVLISYLTAVLTVFTILISKQALAKDVGVCVQIVEHLESASEEKTGNAPDNSSENKTDSAKGATADSISKTDTAPAAASSSDADNTGKARSETNKTEIANPIAPAAPLPAPDGQSPQPVSQVKDFEVGNANSEQQLAAARSQYEMSKPAALWENELDILPYGQTALVYLKRLFEHFVTHEPGFASTEENCDQTITVELYPLKRGWTAFARYSGTNREERVDQLLATELSQFAERAVLALLNDVPISATIKRDNVLSSDSKQQVQQVKGTNHFTINIGTRLVFAKVNQVQIGGENDGQVEKEVRLYHPMKFGLGYRGRFENWGLEVQGGLGIGVGKKAASSNPSGGHIDYGGDTGLAIHFLNYRDPRGLVSFYLGGGAGFDFTWFSVVNGESSYDTRSYLYSGGLTADGIFGWEFLRAASVQFFLQGELNLPLYVTRTENNYGAIASWMPGVTFKLGVVF
ncbi:MAG: hypothetical protein JXX14_26085 [Deltaproteobacteria bacterium]|nr:hypothetical protein [Deltaproteobacteria bacterium]